MSSFHLLSSFLFCIILQQESMLLAWNKSQHGQFACCHGGIYATNKDAKMPALWGIRFQFLKVLSPEILQSLHNALFLMQERYQQVAFVLSWWAAAPTWGLPAFCSEQGMMGGLVENKKKELRFNWMVWNAWTIILLKSVMQDSTLHYCVCCQECGHGNTAKEWVGSKLAQTAESGDVVG